MPKPKRNSDKEEGEMEQTSFLWVGIDWGDQTHAVHVFEPSTGKGEQFVVPHSAQGLQDLAQRLAGLDRVGGIAVEATRNLLLLKLAQAGLPVYAINPKVSKDWRSVYSVAGAKSDEGDARTLAEGLSHHHSHLTPLASSSPVMRELTQLCEDEKHFIDQRTGLIQQLKAVLKQYHPQLLAFFGDWTAPSAWDFALAFPTPEALAKASKDRICRFLRARHIGIGPLWQQRIEQRVKALEWPQDCATASALALRVQTLASTLKTLEKQLCKYRERIESLFPSIEGAQVFSSLPGAGPKLAPRLCVMFGDDPTQYGCADAIRQLSGVAPVTKQSGKRNQVVIRRACRKYWRNTLHLHAQYSKKKSLWATAFYKRCRERGDTHATARTRSTTT
jgi:transposase